MSFCPCPLEPDFQSIMASLENFNRQIKRSAFFNPLLDQEDPTTNPVVSFRISQPDSDLDLDIHPFDHHKFCNPSSFNPKLETHAALNSFSKSVTLEVYKTKTLYSKFQNYPKELRQALDELKIT